MSGVMGFGMGGLFGMFMASVRSISNFEPSSQANIPARCPTIHLTTQPPPVARKAQSHRFLSSNNSRSDSRIWEHDHGLWPRTSEKLALCTLA